MTNCELCGKSVNFLNNVKIAGTLMKVCSNCSNHGRVIENKKTPEFTFKKNLYSKEEEALSVKENFSKIISEALVKKNLDSHKLARAINLKESTLQKYLTNKIKPDISTAKRMEKFLEVNLLEKDEVGNINNFIKNDDDDVSLSLGDLLEKELKNKR